jgi:hypothetical protein
MDQLALLFALHFGPEAVRADDFASLGVRTEVEALLRPERWYMIGPVGTLTFCGEESTVIFASAGIRALVRPTPNIYFGVTIANIWVHAVGSSTEQAIAPELVVGGTSAGSAPRTSSSSRTRRRSASMERTCSRSGSPSGYNTRRSRASS